LRNRGKVLCAIEGVTNVNVQKNAPTRVGSVGDPKASSQSSQEDTLFRYTSNAYQKILDYHVSEILLTTIILGVVLLLRLHR
jgi:hypothetical protein